MTELKKNFFTDKKEQNLDRKQLMKIIGGGDGTRRHGLGGSGSTNKFDDR